MSHKEDTNILDLYGKHLEPCPVCGYRDALSMTGNHSYGFYVVCDDCYQMTIDENEMGYCQIPPRGWGRIPSEAITDWDFAAKAWRPHL